MKRHHPKRSRGHAQPPFERRDVPLDALRAILDRAKSVLSAEDHAQLWAAVDTLAFLTQQIGAQGATIARLRKLFYGATSEKTRKVLGDAPGEASDGSTPGADEGAGPKDASTAQAEKKPRKGHGRNGAAAYLGAERKPVSHPSLGHGQACPGCTKGKVYRQLEPALLLRIHGVGPLSASRYELERLRCNLCGEVFTAPPPPGVGDKKYDESAAAMIGLLNYGCGLPFNRLERLGENLGIPMPAATQWEVVAEAAQALEPAWTQLVHEAAQGEVVYIDDTHMKVLELADVIQQELAKGETDRTGVFTSGVVATVGEQRCALFFTGRRHAGENLAKVLAQRSAALPAPIQMSDALACNTAGDFEAIVANCLAHARRYFVDLVESFPDEVRHVLETLRDVYRYDAEARQDKLSPEERLSFHQAQSGPLMADLKTWLKAQTDERRVEPNSPLGGAIQYMENHWNELTLFLRQPGAPLDNNICERALKKAILHRKNSLFYRTENGAHVGDVFMSLIYSAELCRENAFEYLVALQRHPEAVALAPANWMPWNYRVTLDQLASGPRPPP